MTTGDYLLWFGALLFLIIMAGNGISLAKFAVDHVNDWGWWTSGAIMGYLALVIFILSPTYYLVTHN